MKKRADKSRNVNINVNLFSNNNVDGKSIICFLVTIVSIILIASICDPNARAEIIRLLISMATDC